MSEKAKKRVQWLLMQSPRLMRALMAFDPEEDAKLLRTLADETGLPQVKEHMGAMATFVGSLEGVQNKAVEVMAAGNQRRGQA